MSRRNSTLRCVCGQVRLNFPQPAVLRRECCCVDCRKGLRWCVERGGPPVRSDCAETSDPPADLLYYPNALSIDSGSANLKCYVIKSGFPTKRVVASCCWTVLCGDHPNYKGILVVTYPGHAILENDCTDGTSTRPFDSRQRENDMSASELAALPPRNFPASTRTFDEALTIATSGLSDLARAGNKTVANELISIRSLIGSLGVEVADPNHEGPVPAYLRDREALIQVRILDGGDRDAYTAIFTVPENLTEMLVQNPVLANGSRFELSHGPSINTIASTFSSSNPQATAEAIKQRLLGRVADPNPPGIEACAIQ